MADTLKFGPDWLRALSDGNTSTATPPPSPGFIKYKLAEHRYGREEMLALFIPSPTVPSDLIQHTSIVVEKVQDPLALVPLSEEEQHLMSQSVNSSAVLRQLGRGAPPIRGVRGGGVERGRVRGRGRGDPYIQRNLSFEEDEGPGFVRPQSSNRLEPWEEGARRYTARGYEEAPISPRRDISRSMSSDNWRDRERTGEENSNGGDGDWRRAGPREKWDSRRMSWRDPGPSRGPYDPEIGRSNGYQKDRGYERPAHRYQRSMSGECWVEDDVPEWSMPNADDLEEPGTFDASGQFVFTKSSDEGGALEPSDGDTKSLDASVTEGADTAKQPETRQEKIKDDAIKKVKERLPPVVEKSPPTTTVKKRAEPSLKKPNTKMPPSSKKSAEKESTTKGSNSSSVNSVQKVESVKKDTGGKLSSKVDSASTVKNASSVNKDKTIGAVKKEKSAKQGSGSKPSSEKEKVVQNVQPATQSTEDDAYKDLEKAAENLVATMTEEDEDKHLNHPPPPSVTSVPSATSDAENAMKWFYRDPQGDVQGPFTSDEMAEWFSAGYFTMNLLVKRGRDDRFKQLGELIKHSGGVPFLSNPTASPTTTPSTANQIPADVPPTQQPPSAAQQEQMKMFQAMMLQQHMVQQQYLMRQMQVQQTVERLQEQEAFKALPIAQQHQLAMQLILKQQQQQMLLQQRAQQGSPRTTATESVGEATHPVFQRSVSQPAELTAKQIEDAAAGWSDMNSIGAESWSQPSSVWDLDQQPAASSPSVVEMQNERTQRLKEQEEDDQRKRQEDLLRKQEEILRKTEEMLRMKEEIERQKQQEMRRIDELRRKQEEEFRQQEDEQRRLQEERQKKEEDEYRLHQEELRKQEQEILRQQEAIRAQEVMRQQEAIRAQEAVRQQQMQKQEMLRKKEQEAIIRKEMKRQQEADLEGQRQAELSRRQEIQRQQEVQQRQQEVQRQQQQEALRRLQQQQEQLNNIQLPPSAQWANQPNTNQRNVSMSLAEIQQREEMERQETEELSRQMEVQQRLHMQALQQQQQHKSWSNQMTSNNSSSAKSLLEIQDEQARQLKKQEGRKQKQQQQQQPQARSVSMVSASVWGSATASHWSTDTSQGTEGSKNANNNPLGFWDDAIIASKKAPPNSKAVDNNFPTLAGQPGHQPVVSSQSSRNPKVSKSKKEEETLQRLFQTNKPGDDFTKWCESTLKNMATSVDIPTFVAFLQEVESPYEVHDYVRSYLGEAPSTQEFARQFLEMRSQYKNKGRPRSQAEDSIWGPPPVNNPRDSHAPPAALSDEYQKAKGKGKKKRMQKLDGSILGFTVQANTNRINVGEIDIADA